MTTIESTIRAYMQWKIGDLEQLISDHPEFDESEARSEWERIASRDDATDVTTGNPLVLTDVPDAMWGLEFDIENLLEVVPDKEAALPLIHSLINSAAFEAIIHLYTAKQVAEILDMNPVYVRRIAREVNAGWLYGDQWLYTPGDIEALRNRGDGRRKPGVS